MKNTTKLLGERIKGIRKLQQISQEELGYRANLHPSHMGQIERGERSPTVETLEKIVTALNISFEELFKPIDINSKFKEESTLLEIMNYLNNRSIDDQKFMFNILKGIFDWKDTN